MAEVSSAFTIVTITIAIMIVISVVTVTMILVCIKVMIFTGVIQVAVMSLAGVVAPLAIADRAGPTNPVSAEHTNLVPPATLKCREGGLPTAAVTAAVLVGASKVRVGCCANASSTRGRAPPPRLKKLCESKRWRLHCNHITS